MSPVAWGAVALLGGSGAIGRFLLDGEISRRLGRDFPVGTLAINLSGAFLLGLLAGLALTGEALVLAGSATLGSYTTFSTWMLETERLGEEGELRWAALNIIGSLLAGVGAVALGRVLGAHL